MHLVDLSHTLHADMPRFSEQAPAPEINAWLSHAESRETGRYEDCSCEITRVTFLTSLGTYMDSPFHFDPKGSSIERIPLETCVLPGVIVDCSAVNARQPITPDYFSGIPVEGRAVLLHTGWSRYWGQPRYNDYPFPTAETAQLLRDRGAGLVGIDTLVIDDTNNPRRPVHVTLLHAGIPIVENLTNLERVPDEGFVFHAAPVKVAGAAAFPVRAYAAWEATGSPHPETSGGG